MSSIFASPNIQAMMRWPSKSVRMACPAWFFSMARGQSAIRSIVTQSGRLVHLPTLFLHGQITEPANEGLIDEYLFIVTPVVAGTGKPLFKEVGQMGLTLKEAKPFPSGNLVLRYELQR